MRKRHGKGDREIAQVLAFYRAAARCCALRQAFLAGTPIGTQYPRHEIGPQAFSFLERLRTLSFATKH